MPVNSCNFTQKVNDMIWCKRLIFILFPYIFVERSEEDNSTIIYALSDFGTTGKYGVRKDGDYMSNYFVNRYGAIRDIDFTPIFENINEKIGKAE